MIPQLTTLGDDMDECCSTDEAEGTIKSCTHTKTKIWTTIRSDDGGTTLMRKDFVDNGNTTHGGVCISEGLHKELGLKFKSRQKITLNTAAKGGKLDVLGNSRPILVKFDGINTQFKICPLVIRNLRDDINVGTGFLQKHRFTLSFDPMGTKLQNWRFGFDQLY